jgi:hypothetical protein
MDSASSVASQVTVPETALRVRTSLHFLLLAVGMAVVLISLATLMPDLHMVVGRRIMSTWLKLRINQKL